MGAARRRPGTPSAGGTEATKRPPPHPLLPLPVMLLLSPLLLLRQLRLVLLQQRISMAPKAFLCSLEPL